MTGLKMPKRQCYYCKRRKLKVLFNDTEWNRGKYAVCRQCRTKYNRSHSHTGRRTPEADWKATKSNSRMFKVRTES